MIVKCSHCKKILLAEDFDSHKCDLQLNANREIPVVYYRDDSQGDKKRVTAWGVDGVLYTFEVVPRKPIPLILPIGDEISHGKKFFSGDGDFPEPLNL